LVRANPDLPEASVVLYCDKVVPLAEEINMAKMFAASLSIAVMAAIGMVPNAAQARDYPFCIKGADYGSPVGDCSFDTFEQCQATASGRMDFCAANPYFAYAKKPPIASPMQRRGPY
jgi:hypothetical protein